LQKYLQRKNQIQKKNCDNNDKRNSEGNDKKPKEEKGSKIKRVRHSVMVPSNSSDKLDKTKRFNTNPNLPTVDTISIDSVNEKILTLDDLANTLPTKNFIEDIKPTPRSINNYSTTTTIEDHKKPSTRQTTVITNFEDIRRSPTRQSTTITSTTIVDDYKKPSTRQTTVITNFEDIKRPSNRQTNPFLRSNTSEELKKQTIVRQNNDLILEIDEKTPTPPPRTYTGARSLRIKSVMPGTKLSLNPFLVNDVDEQKELKKTNNTV